MICSIGYMRWPSVWVCTSSEKQFQESDEKSGKAMLMNVKRRKNWEEVERGVCDVTFPEYVIVEGKRKGTRRVPVVKKTKRLAKIKEDWQETNVDANVVDKHQNCINSNRRFTFGHKNGISFKSRRRLLNLTDNQGYYHLWMPKCVVGKTSEATKTK